jgi:hypothetical protein
MPARAALAPLAVAVALAVAPPAAARGGRHPDVKGEEECATCHRADTPESFAAWERSPHGAALVKCVVCHGPVGAGFSAKPAATTCQGCHAAQTASLGRRPVKDCFACHAPHALTSNPHR